MHRLSQCLVSALTLVALASPVHAAPFLISKAVISLSGTGSTLVGDQQNGGLVEVAEEMAIDFTALDQQVLGEADAAAAAYADFGRLGVDVEAKSHLSLYPGALQAIAKADAEAIMSDVFDLSGFTSGYMRFYFAVDGIGPEASLLQVNQGNSLSTASLILRSGETGDQRTFFTPGLAIFEVPVSGGFNPVTFSLSATATCIAAGGAICFAQADYLHTATITGIELLDSNGAPATGASFAAQSGHDYPAGAPSVAVPEPGTALVLLTGASLLAARQNAARRRRRSRGAARSVAAVSRDSFAPVACSSMHRADA